MHIFAIYKTYHLLFGAANWLHNITLSNINFYLLTNHFTIFV
nr:MAG TPA: hypothetical protein [Caudoviricetes sp.]